jgi:hypothetical protein
MDVMNLIVEYSAERAHDRLVNEKELGLFVGEIYEDENADVISYTEEAQDRFNNIYDEEFNYLLSFSEELKTIGY